MRWELIKDCWLSVALLIVVDFTKARFNGLRLCVHGSRANCHSEMEFAFTELVSCSCPWDKVKFGGRGSEVGVLRHTPD